MASILLLILLITSIVQVNAFPRLAQRADAAITTSPSASAYTWSPSQLVDVTGVHAYADPLPGQARGPCPAQNALANHGYLNRSGYTTLTECVTANGQVYNMFPDFATFLCLLGQFTGGDLVGDTWSIGNSSAFDSTIQSACPCNGWLGCFLANLTCALSNILDKALGTAGFGIAQTHNSFEADSSIMTPDYTTLNGLDASTRDPTAVAGFFSKHLPNGTWDDTNIWIDCFATAQALSVSSYPDASQTHKCYLLMEPSPTTENRAYYRMNYGIQTNPCYFRTPQATLFASLGAYAFTFKLFSNHTPEYPEGTLNGDVLSSFFSFQNTSSGTLQMKGLGHEQIPANWYKSPVPYNIPGFLTVDYPPYFEKYPELASLGGNTNGVNTYTGLDIGNLTGGVINGQNLLQSDNFVCFLYRVLQIQLENKLPGAVGGALLTLGATLGDVLNVVMGNMCQNPGGLSACPVFTYKDIHSYTSYCGVRQQPAALL